MLTPLMKNATGNDARPVSAKDCDYAAWMNSIHRTIVKSVSENKCPQQLGIGVSTGLELKNIIFRICSEERLALCRGGALAKDDRINAHNTFDNKRQVATS
jgi:hypothetical protein